MTDSSKPKRKAAAHLGLRLSIDELTLLHKIVRQINDELHRSGMPRTMGPSRLIRRWIREEAERRGLARGAARGADATRSEVFDEPDLVELPPKTQRMKR